MMKSHLRQNHFRTNVFERLAPRESAAGPSRNVGKFATTFQTREPSYAVRNQRFDSPRVGPPITAAASHGPRKTVDETVLDRRQLFEVKSTQEEIKMTLKNLEERAKKAEAENLELKKSHEDSKKRAESDVIEAKKEIDDLGKKVEATKSNRAESLFRPDPLGLESKQRLFRIKCSRCGFDPRFELRESNKLPGYFMVKGKGEEMKGDE